MSSEVRYPARGATKSGENALTISSGQMVRVMAVPAFGAILKEVG